MIRRVELTRRAEKQVRKVPTQVGRKLMHWVALVRKIGLEEVRRIPGFHDEPLAGPRLGTRSIRLNRAYRAFYRLVRDGEHEVLRIEEVSKHDY